MKKVIVYYLTLNLIIASLYVPVFVHTCYLFDDTSTSVFYEISCSEAPISAQESLDFNCCSQELSTYSAQLLGSDLSADLMAFSQLEQALLFVEYPKVKAIATKRSSIVTRPPPHRLYNRTLLSSIQTLRI